MIRQPTPVAVYMAWHRAVMQGQMMAQHDGMPECGWFKRQAVKNGPWLPVRIWLDQQVDPSTGELVAPETMQASCLGKPFDAARHWTYLTPISRDEYERICRLHGELPAMASTSAIDLSKNPIGPTRTLL